MFGARTRVALNNHLLPGLPLIPGLGPGGPDSLEIPNPGGTPAPGTAGVWLPGVEPLGLEPLLATGIVEPRNQKK